MNMRKFSSLRNEELNFHWLGYKYTQKWDDFSVSWVRVSGAVVLVEIDARKKYLLYTAKKAVYTAQKTIFRHFGFNVPTIKIKSLDDETIKTTVASLGNR